MSSDWLATPRATRHATARHAIPTGDHHNLTEHDARSPLIDHIVMERLINGEPTAAKTTERYAAARYLHHHQPDLPLRQIARLIGSSRRSVERWNADQWPNRWADHTPTPTLIWKEPTTMDWRHRAVCREEDPELFFPIGNSGAALDQLEEAKAVCRRCPVQEQCLAWALESRQDAGVWGGLSEDERRRMLRRKHRRTKTEPAECGSRTAYKRHLRRGEPPCQLCTDANRSYASERNARLREGAAA